MDDLTTVVVIASSAFFVVLSVALLYRYRQVSAKIAASNDLGRDLWQALEARMKKQDERILDMMAKVDVIHSRAVEKQAKELPLVKVGLEDDKPVESPGSRLDPSNEKHEVLKGGEDASTSEGKSQDVTKVPGSQQIQPGPNHLTDSLAASILREIGALETRLRVQDERLMDVVGRLEATQLRRVEARPKDIVESTHGPLEKPQMGEGGRKVSESDLIGMLAETARTSVEIRQRFGISREHASRVLKGLVERGLAVENAAHKPYVYELTDAGRKSLSPA